MLTIENPSVKFEMIRGRGVDVIKSVIRYTGVDDIA